MPLVPSSFYLRPDVVQIARELLGKILFTRIAGITSSGIICETEAYAGTTDKASHAYRGRRTNRTEVMYSQGGNAYVYLCYGIHSLFNVVTNVEDVPHAVLIRGIIPVEGIEAMLRRAGKDRVAKDLGNGPGKVSRILGINCIHSGINLQKKEAAIGVPAIWIEDKGNKLNPSQIMAGPRIGVDFAGEDAFLPYRFTVGNMKSIP